MSTKLSRVPLAPLFALLAGGACKVVARMACLVEKTTANAGARWPCGIKSRSLLLLNYGDRMPWPGFEPGCLAALPPQDSVSTSFTTRAGEQR